MVRPVALRAVFAFVILMAFGTFVSTSAYASDAWAVGDDERDEWRPRSPHRVEIDCSVVAEQLVRQIRVRDRDTFGHIAKRELGSVRQVHRIRELNPGIMPTRIRPGQALWLPPRNGGYALFLWHTDGDNIELSSYAPGQEVPDSADEFSIVAVPTGKLESFRKWQRSASTPVDPAHIAHAMHSPVMRRPTSSSVASGTDTTLTTCRLTAIGDDGVSVERSTRSYDRQGRPLVARSRGQGLGLLISAFVVVLLAGVVIVLAYRLERT